MFDVNNKQYILSLSTGRKAYIYYSQGNGILMRWNSEDGKWQEPVTAAKNGLEGFSACLDKEDGIHMLYQDYGGNIIYMKYTEGAWNRRLLLRSRDQDTEDKQLHLACCENGIYAFFVIEYAGKRYLSFQDILSSDNSTVPKTIDQVGGFPSYRAFLDNTGGMWVFYRSLRDGKKTSGFRTYENGSAKWGSFHPLPSPLSDLKIVCAAESLSGDIHLCLQRNEDKKYILLYSKSAFGTDGWESMPLAESEEMFNNTEFTVDQGGIRVFWSNKTGIFCRTSHDDGSSWDMEQKLEDLDEKHTSCFSYIQSTGGTAPEVHTSVFPGSFKDIPKLTYLEIPPATTQAISSAAPQAIQPVITQVIQPADTFIKDSEAESLKKAIAETLKLLSGNINDLRDTIRELSKRLDSLDAHHQHLELDITKCGIKDKYMENDMLKIKSELESLKNRMNENDAVKAKPVANPVAVNSGIETVASPVNIPLMPGSGFNSVTTEYLKGLKK